MNLDQLSQEVYRNKVQIEQPHLDRREVAFDPATLALIFSATKQVIKCIKKRKEAASSKEVNFLIKSPSRVDIIRMRWIVRRAMGFWRFRKEGKGVVESLLRTGGNLTLEQIADLLSEKERL